MTDIWVPEFQRVDLGIGGQPFEGGGPWKIELHMTQGNSIEGAEGAERAYPPHGSSQYDGKKRHQYVPLNRAAYANLGHDNDASYVIQWEIVGFSENAPNFWPEELDWIGTDVLAPIARALQGFSGSTFALTTPPQGFHGGDEGIRPYLASAQSPMRFKSDAELDAFSGVLGHQHMPAPDDHWDPGRLDVARILVACAWSLGQNPVPPAPMPVPSPAPLPNQPVPVPPWYNRLLAWHSPSRDHKPMMQGWDVVIAQNKLILAGHGYATKVDGWFGKDTDFSVRSFQREVFGKADGIIGPNTARALGV